MFFEAVTCLHDNGIPHKNDVKAKGDKPRDAECADKPGIEVNGTDHAQDYSDQPEKIFHVNHGSSLQIIVGYRIDEKIKRQHQEHESTPAVEVGRHIGIRCMITGEDIESQYTHIQWRDE